MLVAVGKAGAAGVLVLCLAAASLGAGGEGGDAKRGKERYVALCGGCHALNYDKVGPRHRGVYGRKAGAVPNYDYSAALKNSGVVWDAETLDKWLAGPEKFIPGQKMNFAVGDPQTRADIIAYLKTVSR